MARISFSALVEEIVGKLAGSVFQDSYGGYQIRTRVTPKNPQTTYQQLRRGEFGYISSLWRTLTGTQRQTFIDAAGTPPAALNLFIQSNVNLSLVNEAIINSYTATSDPGTMTIIFMSSTPSEMLIRALGGVTTVPAGTKLLLQLTNQRPPTRIFTTPSDYSPVVTFDEGIDLSIQTDILSDWQSRYGVLGIEKRLCLKSALIDKSNGRRGADVIQCTISEEVAKFVRIKSNFVSQASSGTGVTDCYPFTVPANTLITDGDTLRCEIWGDVTAAGNEIKLGFDLNGTAIITLGFFATQPWHGVALVMKSATGLVRMILYESRNAGTSLVERITDTAIDMTTTINLKWTLQATTSGTMTARAALINKELV